MKIKLKAFGTAAAAADNQAAPSNEAGPSVSTAPRVSSSKRKRQDVSGEDADFDLDAEDPDYEGSDSGASDLADEDFLNAPVELPPSSGDEYTDPNVPITRRGQGRGRGRGRRRHFADSASPRPQRGSHRLQRISDSEDDSEPSEGVTLRQAAPARKAARPTGTAPRKRGRPPKEKPEDPSFSIRLWTGQGRQQDSRERQDASADGMGLEDDDGEDDDMDGNDSRAGSVGLGNGLPMGARRKGGPLVPGGEKQVKGTRYKFEEDELQLPVDPKGEQKVDHLGNLLGGREYKADTFKSPSRPQPDRVYMLAIDAARCAGFRDSLYFFRRNPWIQKLNANQAEKDLMVEKKMLHINLRSRQVSIITAHNCYKVFGARFIKNGRNVYDDYYETAALARGLTPGSPAFIESYDPEVDNTTLAMPKIGAFALKKGEGRPAHMKMAKASEAHIADDENVRMATPDLEELAKKENAKTKAKKDKDEESSSSEESDGRGGRRKKRKRTNRSAPFFVLRPTQTYLPNSFGTSGGQAGPQFGTAGLPPFGDQWERSKARKPAPHLNGRNWMFETAKSVQRNNKALRDFGKEYNAYHSITLGAVEPGAVLEEAAGFWDDAEVDDIEQQYDQSVEPDSPDEGEEVDDRNRGRSPGLLTKASDGVKQEYNDNKDLDALHVPSEQAHSLLPRRRKRSPIRGHYEQHSRLPQVQALRQPTRVLKSEQAGLLPSLGNQSQIANTLSGTARLISSIEYSVAV